MTNDSKPIPAASVPERLRKLLGRLGENLIERETPLRLAILSALCGEHLLLIGPPGTAKSALARRMRLAFPKEEGGYFERLLTRFTVPEELFGPLSIKGLEDDRYERLTSGYLPAASIAFLDEIFKANSAILNALLTLLNEREFDNGARRVKVPLVAVVGASNELPEGEELNALFDRFLFRYHVPPVSPDSFPNLLEVPGNEPTIAPGFRFAADELCQIRKSAETVSLPDNVKRLLGELRAWCQAENIAVSDRRWRKIVTMLKVSAFSSGRKEVSLWDTWLVQHCVWEKPEQQETIHEWYENRVGISGQETPGGLVRLIQVQEKQLLKDKQGDRQHKQFYVQRRVKEVEKIQKDVEGHLDNLVTQKKEGENNIRNHLWVPDDFARPAAVALDRAVKHAHELLQRVKELRKGFKSLPLEKEVTEADLDDGPTSPTSPKTSGAAKARRSVKVARLSRRKGGSYALSSAACSQ